MCGPPPKRRFLPLLAVLLATIASGCGQSPGADIDAEIPPDAGPKCSCQWGELCVRYVDGTCMPFYWKCVEAPADCTVGPGGRDPLCNPSDGGITYSCEPYGYPCTPALDAGVPEFDIVCYGP